MIQNSTMSFQKLTRLQLELASQRERADRVVEELKTSIDDLDLQKRKVVSLSLIDKIINFTTHTQPKPNTKQTQNTHTHHFNRV